MKVLGNRTVGHKGKHLAASMEGVSILFIYSYLLFKASHGRQMSEMLTCSERVTVLAPISLPFPSTHRR